jgi:hypothetical protein
VYLVAPTRPCVAGGQKAHSCHFRRPFFGSFFGRTKKEQEHIWASLKTEAQILSAALIFFGYFFVSRQKSNWGLGQRPMILKAEVVLSCALFPLY